LLGVQKRDTKSYITDLLRPYMGPDQLDIEDFILNEAELVVVSEENKQFRVIMETDYEETLRITVHNVLGQKMLENQLENNGTGYVYELDMSYAARGVYLVRVGTREVGKVQRFIVK